MALSPKGEETSNHMPNTGKNKTMHGEVLMIKPTLHLCQVTCFKPKVINALFVKSKRAALDLIHVVHVLHSVHLVACCIKQHSSCRQLHIPEYWTRGYFTPFQFLNIEIPLFNVCNTVFKNNCC